MTNSKWGHVKGLPTRFIQGHRKLIPVEARFWARVTILDDGCWEWTGSRLPKGYGYLGAGARSAGKVYAHRLSYEIHIGPIPKGYDIDHTCHRPWCVNPKHLEAVPPIVNVRRQRSTKLTKTDVAAIRSSSDRNIDLARRYGVDPSTISRTRAGIRWR